VILFALQEGTKEDSKGILLNPWNKFLGSDKKYMGYIIAEDKEITNSIK
jgi:hypothetical protein